MKKSKPLVSSKLGALAGTTWAAGRIGAELTNNEIEDIQRKVSQIKTDLKTLRDLQDFVCN
ncbi:MAG: hypothetical protein ACK5RO_13105 [Pseudobdellovibrionaceae bacterium]